MTNKLCLDFSKAGRYFINYENYNIQVQEFIKNKLGFEPSDVNSLEIVKKKVFIEFTHRDKLRSYTAKLSGNEYQNIPFSVLPDLTVVTLTNVMEYCNRVNKYLIADQLRKFGELQPEDIFFTMWDKRYPFQVKSGVMALIKLRKELPLYLEINGIKSTVTCISSPPKVYED